MFTIYINNLAAEISNCVHSNITALGILLYADDIALLADSERDLQNMLNVVNILDVDDGYKP